MSFLTVCVVFHELPGKRWMFLVCRHLPPWLLPGYGSDGAHWPAGTPTDTHIQARNWKK